MHGDGEGIRYNHLSQWRFSSYLEFLTDTFILLQVADLICFVASAESVCEETSSYVDSFGEKCLSVFRSLGLPRTAVLIRVRVYF